MLAEQVLLTGKDVAPCMQKNNLFCGSCAKLEASSFLAGVNHCSVKYGEVTFDFSAQSNTLIDFCSLNQ